MPYKDKTKRNEAQRKHYATHPASVACKAAYNAAWLKQDRAKDPEKYRAKERIVRVKKLDYVRLKDRKASLKRKYGMTVEDYDRMFKKQNGVCAICHTRQLYQKLAVDHCHKTGQIRGLLCQHCNRSIGLMFDSPFRLRNAAEYIETSRQTTGSASETPSSRSGTVTLSPALPSLIQVEMEARQ